MQGKPERTDCEFGHLCAGNRIGPGFMNSAAKLFEISSVCIDITLKEMSPLISLCHCLMLNIVWPYILIRHCPFCFYMTLYSGNYTCESASDFS